MFEIDTTDRDFLKLDIYDEDVMSNDLNSSCEISLAQLCVTGGTDQWHEVYYNTQLLNKCCVGKIHLVTAWYPEKAVVIKQSGRKSEVYKAFEEKRTSLKLDR